jgi:hypothetical protein
MARLAIGVCAIPQLLWVGRITPCSSVLPHIGIALQEILDLSKEERDKTVKTLDDVLQKSRKF